MHNYLFVLPICYIECAFLSVIRVMSVCVCYLTRSSKIAIQAKGPDGKWTRKPLAYRESKIFHLFVTRPPEICVNIVF